MSFTPNIPAAGQSLGASRPLVSSNFNVINTGFAVNHFAFDATEVGKHKFCTLVNQGSDPSTNTTEGALFSKVESGATFLFWRRDNNTAAYRLSGVDPVAASSGYSSMPGGITVQWGTATGINSGSFVNFPIPFSTAVYTVQVTQIDTADAGESRVISVLTTPVDKFNVRISTLGSSPTDSSGSFTFLAIGK